ncbi:ribonuclease HII [Schleiferia thermophila]|jgi:ribonuclease HII|uniref:ribonuclease HII n=1 Tax=Schleiferia thermophila TaxID=884107 RepID=UPI0004E78521|nr:ribonuclease HII [Schleiferia thermophila]KFD39903.1 ribonuclease HII [Schleiferia thermophila str. Yellowstone]PMB17259.1 ribonuclease HII [Fischerella thermalis CCMEE 5319]
MSSLQAYYQTAVPEAGCDEAGRGCLAGPVVAAAVILDPLRPIEGLNDSKKLSVRQREELFIQICTKAAAWSIAEVSVAEIDHINILNASLLAMKRAVKNLNLTPALLLIDGNRFPRWEIPHLCFVKGDARFQSIAAASILAKVYRDRIMAELHMHFPHYQWLKNKGYPTKAHIEAIRNSGVSQHHRKKFVSKFTIPKLFDI